MAPKIHGQGTSEAAWRKSAWLAATPLRDPNELLRSCGRVVVVSPHPDDEVLGCGGLLFHARQLELEIIVVAVTDGEACYPEDPVWTSARLRAARSGELAAAMDQLGVAKRCIKALHIPDGEVLAHELDLRAVLTDLLHADDRVLVTWRADGHPDHEAAGRASVHAATACGASVFEFPVWAWHWMRAGGHRSALPGARRYRISADALRAKQLALRCFASQLGGADTAIRAPILPPHILTRFQRDYEVLLHAHH